MENRVIKFRAWDGIRMTTSGIMFNTSTGQLETPTTASISGNPVKYDLMQFTGLTDKNGKELYEGDICEVVTKDKRAKCYIGIVKYTEMGMFAICTKEGHNWNIEALKTYRDIEAIGNIYETPELWK